MLALGIWDRRHEASLAQLAIHRDANLRQAERMNELLALAALLLLTALAVHLARLTARDGYGTMAPPRSHEAERGTWLERELGR